MSDLIQTNLERSRRRSVHCVFFQSAKLAENFQREDRIVFEIAFRQPARLNAEEIEKHATGFAGWSSAKQKYAIAVPSPRGRRSG
jgi:hypothetical protein